MDSKLFDTKDKIDFGQMSGCHFYWIYRLVPTYLEWLIRETAICFTDLNHFCGYGKPIELDLNHISENKKEKIFDIFERFGKNNFTGNSKNYTVTIKMLNEISKAKLVSSKNFKQIDYKFSEELIQINAKKHNNCEISSNHFELSESFNEISDLYIKTISQQHL